VRNFLNIIGKVFAKNIAKLNQKYDGMKEPGRFYTMLSFTFLPWMVLDMIALVAGNRGFHILAIAWIIFLIVIRFWWIEGNLKKWLDEK